MSKKLKLNLEDIKVQSFITGLDDDIIKKMNGGTVGDVTETQVPACVQTPQTLCGITNNPCYTACNGGPAC